MELREIPGRIVTEYGDSIEAQVKELAELGMNPKAIARQLGVSEIFTNKLMPVEYFVNRRAMVGIEKIKKNAKIAMEDLKASALNALHITIIEYTNLMIAGQVKPSMKEAACLCSIAESMDKMRRLDEGLPTENIAVACASLDDLRKTLGEINFLKDAPPGEEIKGCIEDYFVDEVPNE